MVKSILFIILFTVLFAWSLNLNSLSQILANAKERRVASLLAILSGFLLSLLVVFLG